MKLKYLKTSLGGVLLAFVLPAVSAHAFSVTNVGRWKMDENPINANSAVADSVGTNNGLTPSNWSGSHVAAIASSGTGAFYFPGWHNIINTNQVDATASSYTIPGLDSYNPDTSDFQVSVYVKADDPSSAVTAGYMISADTLNIVQKGLSGPTRSQWKVSVDVTGHFICTFRGPDSTGTINNYIAKSTTAYAWGVTRQIECSWDHTSHVITEKVITGATTDTYTAAGPVNITNTSDVTVGKKPGSTYPGDTFAGTIDILIISKGP